MSSHPKLRFFQRCFGERVTMRDLFNQTQRKNIISVSIYEQKNRVKTT
jgi:hypothetical protein